MAKSDCRDCQHLNREYLWCRRHHKGIESPEEEACIDFVPLLWEIDYTKKKLSDLKEN